MALTTEERRQEAFSLALEKRAPGYTDLVSHGNVITYTIKENGMMKDDFTGPTYRVRLMYTQSGTYVRYSMADFLSTTRKELINDAEYEANMGAVSIVLTNDEILATNGPAELKSRMRVHMEGAEQELQDRFAEDVQSAGALSNQIGGLQQMIPTTVDSGTYGGISRADNPIWRTKSYNVDTHAWSTAATQFTSETAQNIIREVVIDTSRNTKGPNLGIMSKQHFTAYSQAVEEIQRINDENEMGKLGFSNIRFYGAGRSIPMVLEGGIGSAMPDNVTYMIDSKGMGLHCHPDRKFSKIGGRQMPVNQDMYVQHIGFRCQLCLYNPLHMSKIYDSDTAS